MTDTAEHLKPTLSSFFRMAVIAGVEGAVRVHIERGDDLNARDAGGQTPLMLAAARNKPQICKLLLAAGANPHLSDPRGNNALFIANTEGLREVALLLEAACASTVQNRNTGDPGDLNDTSTNDEPIVKIAQNPENFVTDVTPDLHSTNHNKTIECIAVEIAASEQLIDFDEDGATLDLSGWEAEEELIKPDCDPTVLATASKVQNAISKHAPIDISADWDDFEAFLPEHATPLTKAEDAEARERLRTLLLRATREGSVPNQAIEDLTRNDDQTPNEEAGALLRMVVNDLGAEADERHEYSTHHDNFSVHVDLRETPDEEQTVDDALTHIDELHSRRNDPLRLYLRAFQYDTLLTAVEEVALGKAMEQGIEAALDALAGSITGIEAVLDASLLVKAGTKPLRWMSSGTRDDVSESEANQGESRPSKAEDSADSESDAGPQDESDDKTPDNELSEFIANVERLMAIARQPNENPHATSHSRGSWLSGFGAILPFSLG